MMKGTPVSGAFNWYNERTQYAFPPKSLFVVLLLMMLAATVPAAGFWFLEQYPALEWLGTMAVVLLACLAVDLILTHRRYKSWAGEWLCGDCQKVFVPERAVYLETEISAYK